MPPSEDAVADTVRQVIAEMFACPPERIGPDTVAEDVDGWDSLRHTLLVVRLGRAFGLALPEEVAEARTVGEMVSRIRALLPA